MQVMGSLTTDTDSANSSKNGEKDKANILLLLTDDQDVLIGGIEHMPILQRYLIDEGMNFEHAFVHTPICCPSRSSILSGRYLHNGGALKNGIKYNCYGDDWRTNLERDTFAVYAKNYGYQTGYAGKYLNTYGRGNSFGSNKNGVVPPGWDQWLGLVGNSVFYDYEVVKSNDGGKTSYVKYHNSSYEHDYLPDLVANRTIEMIENFSSSSTSQQRQNKPFLIVAAWPTPHGPFTPAPEDEGLLEGLQAYRTPNYNTTEEQNASKHWLMRQLSPITDEAAEAIDLRYQLRHESLLSIDRHIEKFVNKLEEFGQLNNTYIIYTSDNGFQLGQHRLVGDKRHLYEHNIRVPMIVRGPDVPRKTNMDLPVLSIDIAPTIVDIVSLSRNVSKGMDGSSLLPLLHSDYKSEMNEKTAVSSAKLDQRWRIDFLISYHGEGKMPCGLQQCPRKEPFHGDSLNNTYHCVRTLEVDENINNIYCHFDDDEDFIEFYDLNVDPWQLNNTANKLSAAQKTKFATRLQYLRSCKAETCRHRPDDEALVEKKKSKRSMRD